MKATITEPNRRPELEERGPFPTPENFRRINAELKIELVTKAEGKQIAQLQSELDRLHAAEIRLVTDGVKTAYREQQDRLAKKIAEGGDLESGDCWRRHEFEEDFAVRRRGIRDRMRALAEQTAKLCTPIAHRWANAVRDLACEIESAERQTAERFAVPHAPSGVVCLLHRAAACIVEPSHLVVGTGASPKTILPFIE